MDNTEWNENPAKITLLGRYGGNTIYLMEFEGKEYILNYTGGIIEHKSK